MRPALTWIGRIVGAVLVLSVVVAGVVYAASERRIRATYDGSIDPVTVPSDSASIARGQHLVRAVVNCELCHGSDLGGAVYMSSPAIGTMAGPNLTHGRGGLPSDYTTADYARAIRRGVRRDGRSLMVMPSEVFTHLSQEDLAAIIAYLQQVPAVDRDVPRSRFGPIGRVLLAAGKMNILVAPKTPRYAAPASVVPDTTPAYGRYLADISGCHGCHGFGLSGGAVAGPPGLPPASNLTPAGLGSWTEADFVRALREGARPDGTTLNEFMPWKVFRAMTDAELHALWRYLQRVPAKSFGNK